MIKGKASGPKRDLMGLLKRESLRRLTYGSQRTHANDAHYSGRVSRVEPKDLEMGRTITGQIDLTTEPGCGPLVAALSGPLLVQT